MRVSRNIKAMGIGGAQAQKNLTIAVYGKTTVGKHPKSPGRNPFPRPKNQ